MLVSLSIDHHRADFDVLGRIEQRTADIAQLLAEPGISRGSVVLATCNRFEAYLDVPEEEVDASAIHPEAPGTLPGFHEMARLTGLGDELPAIATLRTGLDAASHLFAVTGGLESVVVGEGEIAGQVRRALVDARRRGTVSGELERLFRTAAQTSRAIKQRTGLQTAGRSLVRLALAMCHSRVGDWAGVRVLLIGTGAYAGATLAALRARGVHRIGVHSPSGRAAGFAASHGLEALSSDDLEAHLVDADIIVACTNAREPLLTEAMFERAVRPARGPFCADDASVLSGVARPRLVIDMGVPRNVSPDVRRVPGVELLDLETVAKHAPIAELSAEAEAREIVADATAEFARLAAEDLAVPSLVALRTHVHGILEGEIQRIRRPVAGEPDATEDGAESARIEAALRHFVGRLLHTPTVRIRDCGRDGHPERAEAALETLFGISARPAVDG